MKFCYALLLFLSFDLYAVSIQKTVIVGHDELHKVDVILDGDGKRKMLTKSSSVPEPLGNLFFLYALNGGSNELTVDGSTVNQTFVVDNDPAFDLVVNTLAFKAFDGGIKVDKFLGLNNPLASGIVIEIKSEDKVFQFLPINNTMEFDFLFANGPGRSFNLTFASGSDAMVSRFGQESPFLLKKKGTYLIDDYIKVFIKDNLSSVTSLKFLASGAKD